jgi:hypothetical protein
VTVEGTDSGAARPRLSRAIKCWVVWYRTYDQLRVAPPEHLKPLFFFQRFSSPAVEDRGQKHAPTIAAAVPVAR